MAETTTTMNSKYSSIVDTSSDDSDSGDDAPQAVSAKDAANSEKQRQAKDEQRRAAQRKVRKATSQKQANRTKKAASASTASKPEDPSDLVPSTSSSLPSSSTASSSKLDPALFEQADEAFRAVEEAAIRAAAEDQARQAAAGAGGASGKTAAKSAGSFDKGKKRKLDDTDYIAAIQKAGKANTRTVGDVTVQQIDSTAPSTSSAKAAQPKHASVDVASALPANKTRAFLQDRLFKRRRSNTVAGPSSRKKRGKQAEKPHLILDPLLDKKPVKKEKTRTEKKEALRERMRGRESPVTAFTRGNSQTMAAAFGFKRQ